MTPSKHLNLAKISTFHAVCTSGSLRGAARLLNTTASNVSKHIADLEESLGYALLTRQGKGVILTMEGRVFQQYVEEVYAIEDKMKRIGQNDGTDILSGQIKIISYREFSAYFLAPPVAQFCLKHPKVQLVLEGTQEIEEIEAGEVHIKNLQTAEVAFGIAQEYLLTIETGLYASENYIKKYGMPQTLDDLENHKLLCYGALNRRSNGNKNWFLWNQAKGRFMPFVASFNSARALFSACEEGLGIAELPSMFPGVKEAKLVQVLPDVSCPREDLYISHHEHDNKIDLILPFIDYLKKSLQNYR